MKRFSIQQLTLILGLLFTSNVYGQSLSEKQLLEKTLYVTKNVALKNATDVYRLRLYDYTSADYTILSKFPNLTVLSFVEKSKVDVIPLGFKKLANLIYLDISETQIKMVSAFTKKNKKLKIVYAKGGQLDNLEKKALTKRGIKVIDNVSEYPLVFIKTEEKIDTMVPVEETVTISNTNYEKYTKNPLASALLDEQELKTKKIYTSLSEALKEPQNVYRIDIKKREEGMDISNLTTRIGELYNLQELEIFGIYKSLPKEIGKLTQLQKVTLSLPYLEKDLPLEIANWSNVKSFSLRMYTETETNKIIEFNSVCMLTSLEELVFHGQNFHKVPEKISNLSQLKKLTIEFSPLKSITPAIGQLTSLTHLNLSGLKNLTSIPAISSSVVKADFRNLDALVSLDQTFTKAANLDYLTLNSLLSLQSFNQSMSNLKNVRVLWLAEIPLVTKLFDFQNLDKLERVYFFNFANLSSITTEFLGADALEELEIRNCPNAVINGNFDECILLYGIRIEDVKNAKMDLREFKFSRSDPKNDKAYFYSREIPLYKAFTKNEIYYYNYINKKKLYSVLSIVNKTKDKSLVKNAQITYENTKDEINIFLNTISSYPNLDSIDVTFNDQFMFTPTSVSKKLSKIKFEGDVTGSLESLTSDNTKNWSNAMTFINCFTNVEDFYFQALSKEFYEGEFTNLNNVKKLNISSLGQSGIVSNISKMLNACKNLEHLNISEAVDYVPVEIFNITSLKTIRVSIWEPKSNLSIVIPDNIINLKQLKSLDIFINDQPTPVKHTISVNINKLQNLEILKLILGGLNKNTQKITFPTGIENLKNLNTLKLSPCTNPPIGFEKLNLKTEFKCNQY